MLKAIRDAGGNSSVTDYRGRPLTFEGSARLVYVTYDPQSVAKKPENERLILEDMKRLLWKKEPWPLNKFPTGALLGLDTEYTSDAVLDISIASKTHARCVRPTDKSALKRIFRIPEIVGHSIGGDVTSLIKLGCKRQDWAQGLNVRDSFITARMADEMRGMGNYNVESMLLAKHNVESWKHKTEAYHEYDPLQWPTDLRQERCNLDAWGGLHVYHDFKDESKGPVQLQIQFSLTLERIRLAGMYVDLPAMDIWTKAVEKQHAHELDVLTKIAMRKGMRTFVPSKPNDIRELFFKKMKLPVGDYTKTGLPAVTKSFLNRHKAAVPEVAAVLQFRKTDKMFTTYAQGLRAKIVTVGKDSVIPVRVGAMGTRTGRRASSRPNMQNLGKDARAIFFSRWKHGKVLSNDFSKLEIITIAWIAEDEALMEYFTTKPNGYVAIGEKLFGRKVEPGTPAYVQVKSVVLGVNYCMSAFGLARQLWDLHQVRLSKSYEDHEEKVADLRAQYLRMFPQLVAYQKERVRELHTYGSIKGWFGHLRRLPLPREPDRSEGKDAYKHWRRHVGHLEREAVNFPVQNAASYITGTAMLDLEAALLKEHKISYVEFHKALADGRSRELEMPLIVGEIHDDIVLDCPGHLVKKTQAIVKDCMESLRTLRKMKPEFDATITIGQSANSHWGRD